MTATIEEVQEQMLSMASSTNAAKVSIGWEQKDSKFLAVVLRMARKGRCAVRVPHLRPLSVTDSRCLTYRVGCCRTRLVLFRR